MSDAMDWSQDFCLSCDNVNPTHGPYCSEACRLLDLGQSTESDVHAAPYSPSYAPTAGSYAWSAASSPNRNSGLYLPPAINFSALRSPAAGTTSLPNSPQARTTSHAYFARSRHQSNSHNHQHQPNFQGGLTASSSRSSLSSITSTGTGSHGLSSQAIDQLRSYANSFDQSRELRRRMTLA